MTRNHDDARGLQPRDGRDDLQREGEDYVIRREERLVAGTERHVVGRVTMRKRIVEEQHQVTVTLRREEIEVIEEGVDSSTAQGGSGAAPSTLGRDGGRADHARGQGGSATDSDGSNELVLFAERPVITTEWVPVERVRLDRRTVEGVETVTADVAREVIELEDDRQPDARDGLNDERPR